MFKEPSVAGGEGDEGDEDDTNANKKKEDILDTFKGVVYVKEVVREPRIKFQHVPRLGSFMAVPLVY